MSKYLRTRSINKSAWIPIWGIIIFAKQAIVQIRGSPSLLQYETERVKFSFNQRTAGIQIFEITKLYIFVPELSGPNQTRYPPVAKRIFLVQRCAPEKETFTLFLKLCFKHETRSSVSCHFLLHKGLKTAASVLDYFPVT